MSPEGPRLRFLHSKDLLVPLKLEVFRRLSIKVTRILATPRPARFAKSANGWNGPRRSPPAIDPYRARRGHRSASAGDNGKRIMKPDLFWIPGPWRGRLAVATRPRGGDWLEDEAAGWRRAGIDVVVSLLEEHEAGQLDLHGEAQAMGGKWYSLHLIPHPGSWSAGFHARGRLAHNRYFGRTGNRGPRRGTLPSRPWPLGSDCSGSSRQRGRRPRACN